jgi:1-deoxyxylulose-5-phosphate synthase
VSVAKRAFGGTGVTVSEIGLGCGGYWGFREFPEKRAAGILDLALEHGVNLVDTGPNYSGGNAEPRLGRLLAGRRERVFLATKVGSRLERGRVVKDWSPGGIRSSVETSLGNLRTDRLDLVQLHSPSPGVLDDEGTLGALAALKRDGLVTFVGLSTDARLAARAIGLGVFDCVMIPYNILHQRAGGRVAESAALAGRAVLARSPMAHAVYEPALFRPTSRARIWYLLRALKNFRGDLARARALRFLRDREDWHGPRTALRFVLENPRITSAIVGTTDPRHLLENLSVSGAPSLPGDLLDRLRRLDP